jgi:hypothetical protein
MFCYFLEDLFYLRETGTKINELLSVEDLKFLLVDTETRYYLIYCLSEILSRQFVLLSDFQFY